MKQYRRAAIVAPVRTGAGTYSGTLKAVAVEDLAAAVVRATVEHSGVDAEHIDEVVFAQSYANSEVTCTACRTDLRSGLPSSMLGLPRSF